MFVLAVAELTPAKIGPKFAKSLLQFRPIEMPQAKFPNAWGVDQAASAGQVKEVRGGRVVYLGAGTFPVVYELLGFVMALLYGTFIFGAIIVLGGCACAEAAGRD